jgi:hypothetical protein
MSKPDRQLPPGFTSRGLPSVTKPNGGRPSTGRGDDHPASCGRIGNAVFALADAPRTSLSAATSPPILVSVPEARRHLGGIGTTSFYAAVKRYQIKLVRLGGRSLVPMTEIERVIGELMSAARSPESGQNARSLASRSVAARRRTTTP